MDASHFVVFLKIKDGIRQSGIIATERNNFKRQAFYVGNDNFQALEPIVVICKHDNNQLCRIFTNLERHIHN